MEKIHAMQYASYYLRECVTEEFERKEWQAATKDKSVFYVYNSTNHCVKIVTTVVNDELKYDVIFNIEGN